MQALHQVATLRSAAGDEWSEHVPERDIVALLAGCGRAERPLDLAVLLRELDRRGRRLAGFSLPTTVDSAGRSVTALTAWLPARVGALAGTSESTLVGGAWSYDCIEFVTDNALAACHVDSGCCSRQIQPAS